MKEWFFVLIVYIENDRNGIFIMVLGFEIFLIDLINRKKYDFYIYLKKYLNVYLW